MTFVYGLISCEMWSYKSFGLFSMSLEMIWGYFGPLCRNYVNAQILIKPVHKLALKTVRLNLISNVKRFWIAFCVCPYS